MEENKKYKNFSQQYRECSKAGLIGRGPKLMFKDHPELLPHPIISHRAAKSIAEELKKDPDFGFESILCLRFGGECSSSHPDCRKLRNVCD